MEPGLSEIQHDKLKELCRKWCISRLSIFGSSLTGQLGPNSDVDLLVEFGPNEQWSLMDLVRAEEEFSGLFGRRVDLTDKKSLERSSNRIRRDAILKTAELIYSG